MSLYLSASVSLLPICLYGCLRICLFVVIRHVFVCICPQLFLVISLLRFLCLSRSSVLKIPNRDSFRTISWRSLFTLERISATTRPHMHSQMAARSSHHKVDTQTSRNDDHRRVLSYLRRSRHNVRNDHTDLL